MSGRLKCLSIGTSYTTGRRHEAPRPRHFHVCQSRLPLVSSHRLGLSHGTQRLRPGRHPTSPLSHLWQRVLRTMGHSIVQHQDRGDPCGGPYGSSGRRGGVRATTLSLLGLVPSLLSERCWPTRYRQLCGSAQCFQVFSVACFPSDACIAGCSRRSRDHHLRVRLRAAAVGSVLPYNRHQGQV